MDKTIIEIADIQRRPVTKKNGEQSMIIAVTDARTKRIAETWDQEWTASWKLGDTVEVIFGESKSWTNPKNNQTKETWPITNPNAPKRTAGPRTYGSSSPEDSAWIIAATLLAPHFVGKKIDLKQVAELVEQVKAIRNVAPAAAAPLVTPTTGHTAAITTPAPTPVAAAPAAPIAAVATPAEDGFEEDEDKPF